MRQAQVEGKSRSDIAHGVFTRLSGLKTLVYYTLFSLHFLLHESQTSLRVTNKTSMFFFCSSWGQNYHVH